MKKVFLLSILLFCVVLCVWSLPRIGAPDPYLTISGGPSISANASGTYTYYIRETGTTVPTHPDPVSMTISGTAMGLGWIDFKITSITINGSNHLTNSQYGEAPTEEIGYMAAVVGIPLSDSVENDDFSFPVRAASWTATPGTYNWSASGLAVRKLARWDGSQWVVHNDTSDPAYRHSASGSGSWTVKKTNVCSFCKRTGVSSATAHHVPCPNPNCNAGRAYWNCYGVPPSHALLATCSSCTLRMFMPVLGIRRAAIRVQAVAIRVILATQQYDVSMWCAWIWHIRRSFVSSELFDGFELHFDELLFVFA